MGKLFVALLTTFIAFSTFAASPTVEELKLKGMKAYEEDSCLDAVKYLFAYLVMESNLSEEKRESIESSIAFCESTLASTQQLPGEEQAGNVFVRTSGSGGTLKPLDMGSGGVLITPDGDLKEIDINTGGVLITTGGNLEEIDINTGGVLVTAEGILKEMDIDTEGLLITTHGEIYQETPFTSDIFVVARGGLHSIDKAPEFGWIASEGLMRKSPPYSGWSWRSDLQNIMSSSYSLSEMPKLGDKTNGDQLDIIIDKKRMEINALENIRQFMTPTAGQGYLGSGFAMPEN